MSDELVETLVMLVHGESGVGKSWLAASTPEPRLIVDAEGGVKFAPIKPKLWDPRYEPPEPSDEWDTCVVQVLNYDTIQRVYDWLHSGKHPFRSVALDSLTEIQKRCIDAIAGVDPMRTQDWGELLRKMEGLVRSFRDLTMHPTKPVQCVLYTALTSQKNERFRSHVQGQLGTTLPQYVDVLGYMYTDIDQEGGNGVRRRMLVQPHPEYDAKDRTDRLPPVVEEPNVREILATVYDKEQ